MSLRKQRTEEAPSDEERVSAARHALLEGVGAEVAASFPGITRLGGQIIAALYLADHPRSMEQLSVDLGRSKSNVFANLRGLEAAGIIERRREHGARHDTFGLRGKYPDVIIGAYVGRLRRVVQDKRALSRRALGLLGEARGSEADSLRMRLADLTRKYDLFAELMERLLPEMDGPVDLEALLTAVPAPVLEAFSTAANSARAAGEAVAVAARLGKRATQER
ncbi:Hypothetical protein CAP_4933 [Chondromyces apiculatus DSM 436]|uniref:HTH marR-type domain-containing protein n=1 Tax=Chondromyces apiculatus DSM 436 TaxID=1192034 RepID=A0A017T4C6_9BACT|nr:Hypothetical protein CAP_4933 [Chondromyces apiculatus DSM 436]